MLLILFRSPAFIFDLEMIALMRSGFRAMMDFDNFSWTTVMVTGKMICAIGGRNFRTWALVRRRKYGRIRLCS